MKEYIKPTIDLIKIEVEDVIALSSEQENSGGIGAFENIFN